MHIKYLLAPFLVIYVLNAISAQDHTTYYLLCNQADSLAYKQDYQSALDKMEEAFQTVDYIHAEKYRDAFELANHIGDYPKAYTYGKMALTHAGERNFLRINDAGFKGSSYYARLQDSTDYFLEAYSRRINKDYIKIIDSLYYVDQRIIRKNKSVKGDYNIDTKSLPADLFELDLLNWELLYATIKKYGYPSEQTVGHSAYDDAFIIILHNIRQAKNEKFHDEFFEYMKAGKYSPYKFSFWYEQYQTEVKGQTFFSVWDGDISADNLIRIDRNRRQYFLKGTSAWEIRKGKKRFRPKQLW